MDHKIPFLILQAVQYLHRQGFGSLRIFPRMNASGTAWRVTVFDAGAATDKWSIPEPADESDCLRYTSADSNEFAGVDVEDERDESRIALLILAALPALSPTDSDSHYVAWYESMMEQVRSGHDLPVAYADHLERSKGWELGWGSGRFHAAPPPAI